MLKQGLQILKCSKITIEDLHLFKQTFTPLSSQINQIPNYEIPSHMKIVSLKELEKYDQYQITLHSLAHIEYNATKAYIDTIIRFIHQIPKELQKMFFDDLSLIAYEESQHFTSLCKYIEYGSMDVHNNLQLRILQSNDSLLGRLAIVSIVNEGRGMDTGQGLVQKLYDLKCKEEGDLLKQIVLDEERHVKVGLYWFEKICELSNLDSKQQFINLMERYDLHRNWKINEQKRRKVGYSQKWIDTLKQWS